MRWPWQRRPRPVGRHAAVPRQRATWAEPVLPPPIEAPASGVLLGFADGSEVHLADSDPTSMALHAVADVLLRRDTA